MVELIKRIFKRAIEIAFMTDQKKSTPPTMCSGWTMLCCCWWTMLCCCWWTAKKSIGMNGRANRTHFKKNHKNHVHDWPKKPLQQRCVTIAKKTRPYTLPLSRGRVGRSGIAKKNARILFWFPTDGRTDQPTDRAASWVACPRLKKQTYFLATFCLTLGLNHKKSMTVSKLSEKSSKCDIAGHCSFICLEMATIWRIKSPIEKKCFFEFSSNEQF